MAHVWRPELDLPVSTQSALLKVMSDAARKAARGLNRDFGELSELQVSRKAPADFVSAADIKAEQTIFEALDKARPGYSFMGEERGLIEGTDKTHTWIVDPLDGTTNFLHAIPHFAINIALEREGVVVAAVTYNPVTNELFWAEKGKGCFVNDKRLRVAGVRRFGAASLDLAYVAAGRLDGFWERDLKPWDMAAGVLMITEGGGKVSNADGGGHEGGLTGPRLRTH